MIVAGTGHRPQKLGGFGIEARKHRIRVATRALEELRPSLLISGMALGWDQALVIAALKLEIPYHAYIPGTWQANNWPESSRAAWARLCECATKVVDASYGGPYNIEAMQVRNMLMVDNCDHLAALWDGSSGGTANCLKYARSVNRPITNFWEDYLK